MLFKITVAIHKRHCQLTQFDDPLVWLLPARLDQRFSTAVCAGVIENVAIFTAVYTIEPGEVTVEYGAMTVDQSKALANSRKEYLLFDWFVEPVKQ